MSDPCGYRKEEIMSRLRSAGIAVLVLLMVGLLAQAQPGGGGEAPRGYLGILVGPAENAAAGSWCGR